MRAANYGRFSHDDGDSESVKLQHQRAGEVASVQAWELVRSFDDDGITGRELVRRPGLHGCLDAVRRRDFSVLIVRDLDRLARGETFAVGAILQQLIDHDVKVWEYAPASGVPGFIKMDAENAIIVAIRMNANRTEALKASVRIKDKLLARDESCEGWATRAPFGWRNIRRHKLTKLITSERKDSFGDIEHDPTTFPILLLIRDLYFEVGTYNGVATELNKRGIKSPEGGPWAPASVTSILGASVYRGVVQRGKTTSLDKGGSVRKVLAPASALRTYSRPEYRVWTVEEETRIDALMASRAVKRERGPRTRKHLASGAVRCGHCGTSIVTTKGGKKNNVTYTCGKAKAGACRKLGYRPEPLVDQAVLLAASLLLTDEVMVRTKAILREAIETQGRAEKRAADGAVLARVIKATERRVKSYQEMAADSEGAEREAHRASLRVELAKLDRLKKEQFALVDSPAPDPKTELARLEAKVDELRVGLRQGGLDALPTLEDLLQGQRLTATRREDGRWDLQAEVDPIRLFFADSAVASVPKKQKEAITGNVTGVTITPVTTGTAVGGGGGTSVPSPAATGTSATSGTSSATSPVLGVTVPGTVATHS